MENEPQTTELTPKQEIFCKNYSSTREFFGNGVMSYCDAYNLNSNSDIDYKSARESASRLLRNVNICQRINSLLEVQGLNDEAVDKQLLFVIQQCDNLPAKVAAIKEYNLLKKRVSNKIIDLPPDNGFKMTIEVDKQETKSDESNKVETNTETKSDVEVSQ